MAVLDGDILRVSVNFELGDGTQYQNIYHLVRDGTDVVSDAAHVLAIKGRLENMYDELLGQVLDDVVSRLSFVDRIEFNEITDQWEVVENIGTFTITFSPTNIDDGLPYQSAPYIIFKTQRPKSVGKKFLFPFAENQQNETVLTPTAIASMVAFGVFVLASLDLGGDATLTMGIVRTGIQTYLNFLVAVVNDVIGSQRRRRPGVGA